MLAFSNPYIIKRFREVSLYVKLHKLDFEIFNQLGEGYNIRNFKKRFSMTIIRGMSYNSYYFFLKFINLINLALRTTTPDLYAIY